MNWRRLLGAEHDGQPRCPQCGNELHRDGYCHTCIASEELVRRAAKPLTSAVLEVGPQPQGRTAGEIVGEIVQRSN